MRSAHVRRTRFRDLWTCVPILVPAARFIPRRFVQLIGGLPGDYVQTCSCVLGPLGRSRLTLSSTVASTGIRYAAVWMSGD